MNECFCPEDWEPSKQDADWIRWKCPNVDIDDELDLFRIWEFDRPRSDWGYAFRTWCARSSERKKEQSHEPTPSYAYMPAWQRQGYKSDEEMQRAFADKWAIKNREWIEASGGPEHRRLLTSALDA